MQHRFAIADVFTDQPFAGNQLAVFPEAHGLSGRAMQAIAREFNFAETTFVLPPSDPRHACRVRIFTPKIELPFAGHPTVGTAAVLARLGLIKLAGGKANIVLEEGIGPVPVEIVAGTDTVVAHLLSEKPVETPAIPIARAAAAAALSVQETSVLEAWFASAGVPFCFVRLKDSDTVDRALLDRAAWSTHFAGAWSPNLYFFAGETAAPGKLYVRMFAPALGIEEDPATGSGAVALAGVLAARLPAADGLFVWQIDQGVAMGRPSRIEASAQKRAGRVLGIKVGGATVVSAEGTMSVPAGY
jgi:trans-2,3-dihydro-3-hydroxyanthranilate isomerase